MKIGIVIVSFLPGVAYGGVASVAAEQARELAGRGHQVTLLTTNVLDPLDPSGAHIPAEETGQGGYRILRFPAVLFSRRFSAVHSGAMLRWLSLHAPEFDVFHVHYGRGIIPFLPVSLLLRRSAKVFLQPHGMLDRTQGLRGWLDVCVTRRQLTQATRVFALHPHEQAMILGIAPSARCSIVPNGVRLPDDLPAWQGSGTDNKTVLFLARLHPRKRVLAFISAARLLRSRRNDVRFRIVGPDGGDLARARAQVRQLDLDGCIEFAGRVSQPEALREYAQAAVYVLPTEDENFSISVLEALMVGTPSVVIRTTRNLDVLRAADAVEISAADPQAISLAVENLLDHPGLCLQRSKNGQKLIRDQLNIARVVDLLEAHYRQDVHP